MASKVIVKIPVAPFGQVNKASSNVNGDIMVNRQPQDISPRNMELSNKSQENSRVAQLEQNIRFLQEQHQLMLSGLHAEIESLKNRNRELQFQLVFVKGSPINSPSSSEDDTKHKVYSSPKTLNITPLQVEILEKELGELKLQLQETESRNVYLSTIMEEQTKKLECYERDREKERTAVAQPDPELMRKLDDAEALIRRLRRENSDLRRENASLYAPKEGRHRSDNSYSSPRTSARGNGSGGRHKGGNGHYRQNWFPPLHSQSYWQQPRGNTNKTANNEQQQRTGSANNSEGTGSLPSLQGQQGGRRANNNHHYQGKYHRGGQQKKQT